MVEEQIQFSAKVKNWVCIKKGKVDAATPKIEVSRILASIINSIDKKIWNFLDEDFDLKNLDEIACEIVGAVPINKKGELGIKGKVSEQKIAESLAKVNNPSTTKKFSQKNSETKNGKEICKAYLTYKVLELLKVRIRLDPKLVEKYEEETHKKKIGIIKWMTAFKNAGHLPSGAGLEIWGDNMSEEKLDKIISLLEEMKELLEDIADSDEEEDDEEDEEDEEEPDDSVFEGKTKQEE